MSLPLTRSVYVAEQLITIEEALSQGDWTRARTAAVRAGEAAPSDSHVLHASGRLCELADMPAEALSQWVHAVAMDPSLAVSWSAIGTLLSRGQPITQPHAIALLAFSQAMRADPTWLLPAWHMALLYHALGQPQAAAAAVARVGEILEQHGQHPKNLGPTNIHNRAYLHLTLGHWDVGFACYEERLNDVGHTLNERATARVPAGVPRWTTREQRPKSVAIFVEQGAGDMFMCLRYALALAMDGVRVQIEAFPSMYSYVKGLLDLGLEIDVVRQDEPLRYEPEAYVWAMSLPGLMEPLSIDLCLPRADGDRQLVAFCWQGSRAHKSDAIRSCPVETWQPIAQRLRTAGYIPVSLNQGEPCPEWLVDTSNVETFKDTAELLKKCAAVVSIDTALVHLAGVEGVPTFAALAALPDWRWGLLGSENRWYPSVTLVRQPIIGDWASVATEIEHRLSTLLSLPEAN